MERESFEEASTAAVMNRHFVNIKIDREERPDLDHIYMDAVQAISGSGGWPLNVFLTPEGKPFFGGTYFPPVKAFNRPSWIDVLQGIAQSWQDKRHEIVAQAENLTAHLQSANSIAQTIPFTPGVGEAPFVNATHCEEMFSAVMKTADKEWGGFGSAPKFPQTFTIKYLLQYHYFTGNAEAKQQALLSIDNMLNGGIYDHIAGGLARYSTDKEWLAPHFEKMLYDNALLINVLCDALQLTGNQQYEKAIRKTLSFLLNELRDREDGFYAALDADSEGEEGKFYIWQQKEIKEILGEDASLFCAFFDVSEDGNWEGKNILRVLIPADTFVARNAIDKEHFIQTIETCLSKLSIERSKRVKPGLDDKILLGWNALLLNAIARAAIVLQEEQYLRLAERNAHFLVSRFATETMANGLFHTYKGGVARYPAFLDDYAYLIAALLQLYKAGFDEYWLTKALDYCNFVIENFSDEEKVFFYFTGKSQQDVIVRKKEIYDGATPSGNAVMAENLYLLSVLFEKTALKERADHMLATLLPTIIKHPGSFGVWSSVLIQQVAGINEVTVVGNDYKKLAEAIQANFIPNMVIMGSAHASDAFPMLRAKPLTAETSIYLCKNYSCLEPVLDVDSIINQISQTNKITR